MRQIRLLQILPGTQLIQLSARTYNLNDSPAFVALSYEWKNEKRPRIVRLNGMAFRIRRNLWAALNRLQKLQSGHPGSKLFQDDAPYFWIDAICINQADDREKCHQVAMMGDIYRRASQTVAWLGPEIVETSLAFDYVGQLSGNNDRVPETDEEKLGVCDLCDRTYFKRVWIVQEIILSKKLHLVCGDLVCSWDAFVNLCSFWRSRWYDFPLFSVGNGPAELAELAELKDTLGGSDSQSSPQDVLASLVLLSCSRECGQIYDRVYAMLGPLSEPFTFDIDYKISIEELMIRTGLFIDSTPTGPHPFNWVFGLTETFRCSIPTETLGRATWYWNVSEVLHNLSITVIGGFSRLDDIILQEVRRLLSDFLCWILAAYGIDLFPIAPREGSKDLSSKLTSFRLFQEIDGRAFNLNWIYSDREFAYHVQLEHKPSHPYCCKKSYARTELESFKCRELLRTYDENVKLLIKMQRVFDDPQDDCTRESRTYSDLSLPLQVRRAVFANLLARLFVTTIEECRSDKRPGRYTPLGNFLLEGDPKETDIDSFLLKSLFQRYRVVFEVDQHTKHPTALQKTDIVAFSRSDRPKVPGGLEKAWSAYLHCNE